MRYARPTELTEDVVPELQLRLSEPEFEELFPVKTVPLDPLAAPEPSRGALIRLDSGSGSADAPTVVRELFSEVDVPSSAIEWNRFDVQPTALAGAGTKFKKGL